MTSTDKQILICQSKKQFHTQATAELFARHHNRMSENKKGIKSLRVYQCKYCELWHTTTQRRKDD